MTNSDSLLGRSRLYEKLTKEQLSALDRATVPAVSP